MDNPAAVESSLCDGPHAIGRGLAPHQLSTLLEAPQQVLAGYSQHRKVVVGDGQQLVLLNRHVAAVSGEVYVHGPTFEGSLPTVKACSWPGAALGPFLLLKKIGRVLSSPFRLLADCWSVLVVLSK
jgi:hypothetical protein